MTALASRAQLQPPPAITPRALVVFRIGMQRFALDAMAVRGAMRELVVTPVPLAAPEIAGIAWYQQKPVTVVDLRAYFGLPARPAGASVAYVMVAFEDERLALLVDKIEDVLTVSAQACSPAPVTMEPAWRQMTAQVVEHENGLIAVLDLAYALRTLSA